jgi:hydrogenase expression/formation protein HypC
MCLGIPGRIVEFEEGNDLAQVDVAGVVREINLALLDGPWAPGDYILIHSGFALERMTAEEASDALNVFADGDLTGSDTDDMWVPR